MARASTRWFHRIAAGLGLTLAAVLAGLLAYAGIGYADALRDAPTLARRADALIAAGQGPTDLGPGRFDQLLRVEDPAFMSHNGVDMQTPGAGMTTLTQALAKRLAFERFRPGLGKIRQTAYALGLEARLTKDQIAALILDQAGFGRGPDGWMTGFFSTSETVFGHSPAELNDAQFRRMIAVLIAPGQYRLTGPDESLDERLRRIDRLLASACEPEGLRDVWLDGCA